MIKLRGGEALKTSSYSVLENYLWQNISLIFSEATTTGQPAFPSPEIVAIPSAVFLWRKGLQFLFCI